MSGPWEALTVRGGTGRGSRSALTLHPMIKRLGAVTLTEGATRLISFIAFPVLTRRLGPAAFGRLSYALALTSWLGLLAAPGFYTYGLRRVALDHGELRRAVGDVVALRFLLASVAYGGLVAYALLGAPGPIERQLLLLCGAMFVVDVLDTSWAFIGMQRVLTVSILTLVTNVGYVVAVIALVRSPHDVAAVPAVQLAQNALVIAGLATVSWRWWGSWLIRFEPARWWGVLRECAILGFATLMTMTYNRIDVVLVRIFRGNIEAGLYGAVYRLMEMAMLGIALIANVVFPVLTTSIGRDLHEAAGKIERYLRHFLGLAIPLSVGGALVSAEIVAVILGPAYAKATPIFAILIFNFLVGGCASLFSGCVLLALRKNREYMVTVTVGAVLNVALNLLLIPAFGMVAAALTTLAAQLAVAGSAVWIGSKSISMPSSALLAKPLVASAAMAAAVLLVQTRTPLLWVTVPIGVLTYAAAILSLERFDPGRIRGPVRAVGDGS